LTKLALVTAESIKIQKDGYSIPCVVLIGRDEQGIKRSWRTPFWPYLYILESSFIRLVDDPHFNLNQYVKEHLGTFVRSLNKKALTKLVLHDSLTITDFIRFLKKYTKVMGKEPIYTYEADLSRSELLALRYMIDKGIKSGVDIDKDGTITPIDLKVKLRKWYIDFEAYSTKMCSHGPKKNEPITMVSIWDNYNEKLYTLYVDNKKWKEYPKFKPYNKKHFIKGFKSEALCLDYLSKLVKKLDPDLFTAWNLDRYDIVKWFQRMEVNKLNPKVLSPFSGIMKKRKPYRIKGRILFDLMRAFKKYTAAELRSYSLLYVTESEKLGLEKIPFKGSAADTWDKYPNIVFKRNVQDVLIIKALDEKHELIETFDDLRREFGGLFHEVLMNYRVIDTALMRFVNNKIALGTAQRGKKETGTFLGAVVIVPVPGKYQYVAQFDFSREYPNIIKMFNISPETYREEGAGYYKIKYKDKIYSFIKSPIGLLPQLVDSFFKKRDLYEKEYAKAINEGNKVKIKMWWRRLFNIKTMTNAIYGVMDYPNFRLCRKECSAATAVIGRLAIEELGELAKKYGYSILYGDTDSIFITLKSNSSEEAKVEGLELAKKFNEGLSKYFIKIYKVSKAPSDLGFKKLYSSFLLVARKYYAGKTIWDEKKEWLKEPEYDFKGIEVIRSDSSNLERETLETIIKMILSDKSVAEIKVYWDKIIRNFWNKVYNYLEISYPLQIKKPFNYYNHNPKEKQHLPAHIRSALYSNKYLNTDFEAGDKPRRLPIKSKKIWTLKFKGEDIKLLLKDVSIAEDMFIPDWVIQSIDYKRIYKRLADKVTKLLNLIQIQTSLEAFK